MRAVLGGLEAVRPLKARSRRAGSAVTGDGRSRRRRLATNRHGRRRRGAPVRAALLLAARLFAVAVARAGAQGPIARCGAHPMQGSSDSWLQECPMTTPRRLLAAAVQGGLVYALGGCGSACFMPPLQTSTYEATRVEVYDPSSNTWSDRNPMPVILFGAAAVAPGNGKIYTFGGVLSGNVVQQYEPLADKPTDPHPEPWTL